MKILVTGGAGFIGSNFIRFIFKNHPEDEVVNFDNLSYAGNLENLKDIKDLKSYFFINGDIRDKEKIKEAVLECDAVVHFAAESHVDRSINSSREFLETNIFGTQNIIDSVRDKIFQSSEIGRGFVYVHVSTDEVYGDVKFPLKSKFGDNINPSSPYSASKAASDMLVLSAIRTYNIPAVITRCTNNYGPYQFPEKIIPLFITNGLEGKELPLYDNGTQVRDWLFVEDHCRAIDLVLRKGKIGSVYDIAAENSPEITNRQIAEIILDLLEKPKSLIKNVFGLRPGHDQRYAVDSSRTRAEFSWEPKIQFRKGIELTVEWYKKNQDWWTRIKNGDYKDYYQKHYK